MNRLSVLRTQWDRSLSVGLLLLGVLVLIVGYRGVSDAPFASQQIPYVISAGLGGVFLLGVAGTLWLSADLQDEWRKLHRLEAALERLPLSPGDVQASTVDVMPDRDQDLLLRLAARLLDEQEAAALAAPPPPQRTARGRRVAP